MAIPQTCFLSVVTMTTLNASASGKASINREAAVLSPIFLRPRMLLLPTNLGVEPYHYGAIILGDTPQPRMCIRGTRLLIILPLNQRGGSLAPLFHTTTEGGDERPSPWGGGEEDRGTPQHIICVYIHIYIYVRIYI